MIARTFVLLKRNLLLAGCLMIFTVVAQPSMAVFADPPITTFAATASCTGGGKLLGFPTWYEYLPSQTDPTTHKCAPVLDNLSNIWLVAAAVIEIMLQVAALVAVAFVMYGGVMYLSSQGEPAQAAKARTAIIEALVGLVIAVMAAVVVGFIAGSIY